MRERKIYVRGRMDSWSSIEAFGTPLDGSLSGSCGLLICFRTKKAFLRQYPKEKPLVMVTYLKESK